MVNFFTSSSINKLYLLNFCHLKPYCYSYLLSWYEIISKITLIFDISSYWRVRVIF